MKTKPLDFLQSGRSHLFYGRHGSYIRTSTCKMEQFHLFQVLLLEAVVPFFVLVFTWQPGFWDLGLGSFPLFKESLHSASKEKKLVSALVSQRGWDPSS